MLVLVTLCCSAQASPDPGAALPTFNAAAAAPYRRAGTGLVEGRLVVQLPDGVLATRDRSPVVLFPDTRFAEAWLRASAREIAAAKRDPGPDDPKLPAVLDGLARATHCDADGYFHFRSLAKGRYVARGRLTIAFPRSVNGDGTRETVYDYSYVWLQSDPIPVGDAVAPDVVFHIVARRDKVSRNP